MPTDDSTLTLALVLTAAGATVSAGVITGLIAIAKNIVKIGPLIDAGNEPTLAFILSGLLVLVAYLSVGMFTVQSGFAAFLAWYGIATISMGTHDRVSDIRGGSS